MDCVLYVRQSRDFTGEELGVTRQREDCQELATRRGWTVRAVLTDNDTSAAGESRRPGFEALLLEVPTVGAVVSWSLDRLTRNARDRLRLLEVGREHGLVLALVRGSDLDLSTPAGRLTADILGSVAQHEIDQKADRQRRAALQRSQLGKPPMGVRLTGYTTSGELVESEAAVIRDVFTRFAEGESLRGLATWLTEQDIRTRHGDPWHPSSIRTILVNPRYAGRAIYQGKTTGQQGSWQPLVDATTFDLVQAKLSDPRRRTQQGTDRKYLGSGLYLCDVCGQPVSAWSGKRYRCKAAHLTRSTQGIDDLVMALIRARLAQPDIASILETDDESSELLASLKAMQDRLTVIGDDYDAGLIDGQRFAIAGGKIRAQIEQVQGKLARVSRDAGILNSPDPVAAFDAAPLMLKRATLDLLCQVRLLPTPRGRRAFDPESVRIVWRGESPVAA